MITRCVIFKLVRTAILECLKTNDFLIFSRIARRKAKHAYSDVTHNITLVLNCVYISSAFGVRKLYALQLEP